MEAGKSTGQLVKEMLDTHDPIKKVMMMISFAEVVKSTLDELFDGLERNTFVDSLIKGVNDNISVLANEIKSLARARFLEMPHELRKEMLLGALELLKERKQC